MTTRSEFHSMGMMTPQEDLDALADVISQVNVHQDAMEIGSWAGRTALVIARRFDHLWCVDTWKGSPWEDWGVNNATRKAYPPRKAFQTFCRNMDGPIFNSVFPCVGHSLTWAAVWNRPLDFVYIDGDHRYEAVKADIQAWLPHVRAGGIIAGHDAYMPSVSKAVLELVPDSQMLSRVWWHKVEVQESRKLTHGASGLSGGRMPEGVPATAGHWPGEDDCGT